jgi:hypothetical protein
MELEPGAGIATAPIEEPRDYAPRFPRHYEKFQPEWKPSKSSSPEPDSTLPCDLNDRPWNGCIGRLECQMRWLVHAAASAIVCIAHRVSEFLVRDTY